MRDIFKNLNERYSTPAALALGICNYVHRDQYDKAGGWYAMHPRAVADIVIDRDSEEYGDSDSDNTAAYIVALLHDTIEDQPDRITLDEIEEMFGATVRNAVDAISRRKEETYWQYIDRCSLNPIARRVKIADLVHNMDLSRFHGPIPLDMVAMVRKRMAPALEKLLSM